MELYERISDEHGAMLKAMLSAKEIPNAVLVKYFEVKQLLDKVDGYMDVSALAMIVLSVRDDPEVEIKIPDVEEENRAAEADLPQEKVESEASEQVDISEDGGSLKVDKNIQIIFNNKIVCGKIKSINEDGDEKLFEIEVDGGETIMVEEREIQVV